MLRRGSERGRWEFQERKHAINREKFRRFFLLHKRSSYKNQKTNTQKMHPEQERRPYSATLSSRYIPPMVKLIWLSYELQVHLLEIEFWFGSR